jgi:hypothetical protein
VDLLGGRSLGAVAGVTFVLLAGPHGGERIKTDGGPNVPAKANHGRVEGTLVPQSNGNEFTFKGNVKGAVHSAGNTSAAAAPEATLPRVLEELELAIDDEPRSLPDKHAQDELIRATKHLQNAKNALAALHDAGKVDDQTFAGVNQKIESAHAKDESAFDDITKIHEEGTTRPRRNKLRQHARAELKAAMQAKKSAFSTLETISKLQGLYGVPPTTPVNDPPIEAPGPLNTIDDKTGQAAGTKNEGAANQTAIVVDPLGGLIFEGPNDSTLEAFGPSGTIGGALGSGPASWRNDAFKLLPGGGGGGTVRGGDGHTFAGYVFTQAAPFERAVVWKLAGGKARRLHAAAAPQFKRITVGTFKGGSALFTVSGRLAFGDHFDAGTTGPFRAFRADLKSRKTAELYRPKGGSSQPLASSRTGLAGGGSAFSDGKLGATLWWGRRHYVRSPHGSKDGYIAGMNEAGVAVGVFGPSDDRHAALYEHGKIFDLNKLIPAGSGWVLTKASDISNAGVVVGDGVHNGQPRGFILDLAAPRS